jgi:hypothetical protein
MGLDSPLENGARIGGGGRHVAVSDVVGAQSCFSSIVLFGYKED